MSKSGTVRWGVETGRQTVIACKSIHTVFYCASLATHDHCDPQEPNIHACRGC